MPLYKIPKKYQDPIDNVLYDLADFISPTLKNIGITPNMITTIGFSIGLIAAYLFYKDQYTVSSLLLLISIFFDSLDGHMARKYNLGSEFGKYYDMSTDIIRTFTLYYIMYLKNRIKFYKIFILSALFFIFSLSHLTCQQKELKEKHYVYDKIQFLCYSKKSMLITRYFGSVMFCFLLSFLIFTWKQP